MLVLTRRPEESLVIDGSIEVRVLSVEGNRVRLGVTAPREVLVLRNELRCLSSESAPVAEKARSPLQRRNPPGLLSAARARLASQVG